MRAKNEWRMRSVFACKNILAWLFFLLLCITSQETIYEKNNENFREKPFSSRYHFVIFLAFLDSLPYSIFYIIWLVWNEKLDESIESTWEGFGRETRRRELFCLPFPFLRIVELVHPILFESLLSARQQNPAIFLLFSQAREKIKES